MRKLHLIRHGRVTKDLNKPAKEWRLGPGTHEAVASLAEALDLSRVRRILTSTEARATETARVLARVSGLQVETRDGFEEHHRDVPIKSDDEFRSALQEFFARPDELVFGGETATNSLKRFITAITAAMNETKHDEIIVTHGTVMSLFIGFHTETCAWHNWRHLKMPDLVALDWYD